MSLSCCQLKDFRFVGVFEELVDLGDDAVHVLAVEDESWLFFEPSQGTKQENVVWLLRGAALSSSPKSHALQ